MNDNLSKFQKGIRESSEGIVLGFLLITIVQISASQHWFPGYSVWLCGLFVIALNIITINSLRYRDIIYTCCWLVSSLCFVKILSPIDSIVNIGGPILIIIIRIHRIWSKHKKDKGR